MKRRNQMKKGSRNQQRSDISKDNDIDSTATKDNLRLSRLTALPTEIVTIIASHLPLPMWDDRYYDRPDNLLQLRKTCKTMQENTLPYFCERFFTNVKIKIDSRHTRDLDMTLYFLDFIDIAGAVSGIHLDLSNDTPLDTEICGSLLSKILAKLPRKIAQRITISRSGGMPTDYTLSVHILVTAFVHALVASEHRVSSFELARVDLAYVPLQVLLTAQRDDLKELNFEESMLLGGTWDDILHACSNCSRLMSLYMSGLSFMAEEKLTTPVEPTFRNPRIFAASRAIVRAVRSPVNGKIESYKLSGPSAWLAGREAVKLGLEVILD
ncbi:hypothetical protein DOTSEDRAFT_24756 [Dothistroma septosporum NZE10]|uniref:Uncharacterized protein n=1 Tax=Dothistroma septosporum (strain NZE10 / CBS 128990) TaxID=675120 RepID=N1PPB1_DOTSN|nr:hypothetical protein DOTSEDRAFT_24756 [Dothistroma septosporum NZE10]